LSKIHSLPDEGGGKSRGHDTDDDSCERAKGTQDVLGSSAIVAVGIISRARRVRSTGSAAGGAGGATGTRGSRGIWVGRSKGLYFERLRTNINISVVEDICQLNGISRGSGEVPQQRGRDESAAYKILESRDDWERGGQYGRVGVCDEDVELVMGLITAVPGEGISRVGNPPES